MLDYQNRKRVANCFIKLNLVSGTLQRLVFHQPWLVKKADDPVQFEKDLKEVIDHCEKSKALIEWMLEENKTIPKPDPDPEIVLPEIVTEEDVKKAGYTLLSNGYWTKNYIDGKVIAFSNGNLKEGLKQALKRERENKKLAEERRMKYGK